MSLARPNDAKASRQDPKEVNYQALDFLIQEVI